MSITRSTHIFFKDLHDYQNRRRRVWDYDPSLAVSANLANPTVQELEKAIADRERGQYTIAVGTGQAAIVTALMAFAKSGQPVLLPDNVYGPVRMFCDNHLKPLGLSIQYYDPAGDPGDMPAGAVLYIETPGSQTFELCNMDALLKTARQRNATTIIDNTWGTFVGCRPLEMGADIVLHSLSKIISGEGEVFGGCLTTNNPVLYKTVKNAAVFLGHWLSPDDAYRILQGMASLNDRLAMQNETAQDVIACLRSQPEVQQLFVPQMDDDFNRCFTTGSPLFSFTLKNDIDERKLNRFLSSLKIFRMSLGWGGPNSLIVPVAPYRTIRPVPDHAVMLRAYIGREASSDLANDLQNAFEKLRESE